MFLCFAIEELEYKTDFYSQNYRTISSYVYIVVCRAKNSGIRRNISV